MDVSARAAAGMAAAMLQAGEPLAAVWRYAVAQLLDDYESSRRADGPAAAARLFAAAPHPTGDDRVDAALAALAEHLAHRDDWRPAAWVHQAGRATRSWWFVSELAGQHPRALVESPLPFRLRGVFITLDALERV